MLVIATSGFCYLQTMKNFSCHGQHLMGSVPCPRALYICDLGTIFTGVIWSPCLNANEQVTNKVADFTDCYPVSLPNFGFVLNKLFRLVPFRTASSLSAQNTAVPTASRRVDGLSFMVVLVYLLSRVLCFTALLQTYVTVCHLFSNKDSIVKVNLFGRCSIIFAIYVN